MGRGHLQKQGLSLRTAALSLLGLSQKKRLFVYTVHLILLFSWLLIFQKCLMWLQHWQKKQNQANTCRCYPTNKWNISYLCVWPFVIIWLWFRCQTGSTGSLLRSSWQSIRSSWPRCSALRTCQRTAPSPSAEWRCGVPQQLELSLTRPSWPGPLGTSGAAGQGCSSAGPPPPAAPGFFAPGWQGTEMWVWSGHART